MDVSIIIVSYNTKDLTKNCLLSIYKHTKEITFEILISDNGSTDGSIDMILSDFPDVILIQNRKNLGFGAANNRALVKATGKYIFYLNSDTLLLNNAVKLFFDYWENDKNKDKIGALGCNLLNNEGQIVYSGGVLPTYNSELLSSFLFLGNVYFASLYKLLTGKDKIIFIKVKREERIGEIGFICGANLFLLNNSNAYFDERFFLYYEETDLQFRIAKKHLKRLLINGPRIIHLQGKSQSKQTSDQCVQQFASISYIQSRFSQMYYLSKNGDNCFFLTLLLKLITLILWINPYLFHKTKSYISKYLKI